jgi:hypothetical protein
MTDQLRDRHDFASWKDPGTDVSMVGCGFHIRGDELPGWVPLRTQTVEPAGEPQAVLSVWRPSAGNGQLLAVNVYECASARAARTHLLRLLGDVLEPDLQRIRGPGEVAFAAGRSVILFARYNYVIFVRSIERTPAPVVDSAAVIDRLLTAALASDDTNDGEARRVFDHAIPGLRWEAAGDAGGRFAIRLHEIAAGGDRPWTRIVARTGDLSLDRGTIHFAPREPGPHFIDVAVIESNRVMAGTLRIDEAAAG